MAWSEITNLQTQLSIGQSVQITVSFGNIPFIAPTESDIRTALSKSGHLLVIQALNTTPVLTANGSQWTVTGTIVQPISGAELESMVSNVLNNWSTWSVVVTSLKTDVGLRPGDLLPSTTTATIWLLAITALAIVGYLTLRKVT